jgi:hypothetical protein
LRRPGKGHSGRRQSGGADQSQRVSHLQTLPSRVFCHRRSPGCNSNRKHRLPHLSALAITPTPSGCGLGNPRWTWRPITGILLAGIRKTL